jgi:hypothetical protein
MTMAAGPCHDGSIQALQRFRADRPYHRDRLLVRCTLLHVLPLLRRLSKLSFVPFSGDTVDVLILRRRYPLLVPFQNLRNVTLHRLSPHALYKEEFDYAVRSPGMCVSLPFQTLTSRAKADRFALVLAI